MLPEIEVLKKVCCILEQTKIPYMITGSFASNFYSIPRMTRDIDIVIEILASELGVFFHAFKNEFYIDEEAILEAIGTQGMFNIIHNDTVFKVDFIIKKESMYRILEFQRRKQVKIDDCAIWIVSPEDLILSKLFWARETFSQLQIKDIHNLTKSLKNIDQEYIYKWIEILNLGAIYNKVRDYERYDT